MTEWKYDIKSKFTLTSHKSTFVVIWRHISNDGTKYYWAECVSASTDDSIFNDEVGDVITFEQMGLEESSEEYTDPSITHSLE